MLDTLDPPRPDMPETTEAPRERHRTTRTVALVVMLVFFSLVGVTIAALGSRAHGHPNVTDPTSPDEPPGATIPLPAAAPAGPSDPETRRTLQDATGLAASLLASTRSTEVARSALVAAQDMTGCAPREGGPAQVHVGNRAERTAEFAARADFYATARENGREYATHAKAYLDQGTIVYVAVAWECGPGA